MVVGEIGNLVTSDYSITQLLNYRAYEQNRGYL